MSEYFDRVVLDRALAGEPVTAVEHEQAPIIRALAAHGLSRSLIAARLSVGNDKITAALRSKPTSRGSVEPSNSQPDQQAA